MLKGVGGAKTILKLSESLKKHILNRHSFSNVKSEMQYLIKKQSIKSIEENLAKRSFFNKGWSNDKIIKAVEKGASDLLKSGKTNGKFVVTQYGEKITIVLKNSVIETAYGLYKYTLKDFW